MVCIPREDIGARFGTHAPLFLGHTFIRMAYWRFWFLTGEPVADERTLFRSSPVFRSQQCVPAAAVAQPFSAVCVCLHACSRQQQCVQVLCLLDCICMPAPRTPPRPPPWLRRRRRRLASLKPVVDGRFDPDLAIAAVAHSTTGQPHHHDKKPK